MENKKPTVRSALTVSLISVALGFINGVWVVLAGTSYFNRLSPYYLIIQAIYRMSPSQIVEDGYYFLFRSGFQLILAPLMGTLLGAVIGYLTSRLSRNLPNSRLVVIGALTGGLAGFASLGIIFLNIYAS